MRGRAFRRFVRDDRGVYLLEYGLSMMIFFLTLMGTVEIGLVVWRYNMVSDLAQEGARRAAVCGAHRGLGDTACNLQTYVQSRATFPVSVTSDLAPGETFPGVEVYVRVDTTATVLAMLIPYPMTLSSTAHITISR